MTSKFPDLNQKKKNCHEHSQPFTLYFSLRNSISIVTNHLLYAGLSKISSSQLECDNLHERLVAVIVYDTLLTLGDEINLLWRRKLTLGSYLYILSRYGTMASLFISCFSALIETGQVRYILGQLTIGDTNNVS